MAVPPVVQTTAPLAGAVPPPAIIEIGHVETGTLANDNGATPAVQYFALQRGTLVTLDSVTGQYLPTIYGGVAAQGPVNIIALAAGEEREVLTQMKVGDVVSIFRNDTGAAIVAARDVTAVGAADFTVNGAPLTVPAGDGWVERDDGTYTGSGTGVLLDGEYFQVGVSGAPATLGNPVYADMGAQILFSGTINTVYCTQATDLALTLLPGALLQMSRP